MDNQELTKDIITMEAGICEDDVTNPEVILIDKPRKEGCLTETIQLFGWNVGLRKAIIVSNVLVQSSALCFSFSNRMVVAAYFVVCGCGIYGAVYDNKRMVRPALVGHTIFLGIQLFLAPEAAIADLFFILAIPGLKSLMIVALMSGLQVIMITTGIVLVYVHQIFVERDSEKRLPLAHDAIGVAVDGIRFVGQPAGVLKCETFFGFLYTNVFVAAVMFDTLASLGSFPRLFSTSDRLFALFPFLCSIFGILGLVLRKGWLIAVAMASFAITLVATIVVFFIATIWSIVESGHIGTPTCALWLATRHSAMSFNALPLVSAIYCYVALDVHRRAIQVVRDGGNQGT